MNNEQVPFWQAVVESEEMTPEQKIEWLITCVEDQYTARLAAEQEIRRLREALHEALNVQTKRELALYREVQQLKKAVKELEEKL